MGIDWHLIAKFQKGLISLLLLSDYAQIGHGATTCLPPRSQRKRERHQDVSTSATACELDLLACRIARGMRSKMRPRSKMMQKVRQDAYPLLAPTSAHPPHFNMTSPTVVDVGPGRSLGEGNGRWSVLCRVVAVVVACEGDAMARIVRL